MTSRAYNNRGVAYHDKGDYDRAIADDFTGTAESNSFYVAAEGDLA